MNGTYHIPYRRLLSSKIADLRERYNVVVVYGIRGADKSTEVDNARWGHDDYDLSYTKQHHSEFDEIKRELEKCPQELFWEGGRFLVTHCEYLPKILNRICQQSMQDKIRGQFLVSISIPCKELKNLANSGNDVAFIRLRPCSLWESGSSLGWVSLNSFLSRDFNLDSQLFRSQNSVVQRSDDGTVTYPRFEDYLDTFYDEEEVNCYHIEKLGNAMLIGGFDDAYSHNIYSSMDYGRRAARDYVLKDLCNYEFNFMRRKKCDFEELRAVLKAYCMHIGTHDGASSLLKNMGRKNTLTKSDVSSYLKALEQSYVIDKLDAWQPKIKTKAHIFTYSLNYLADPSLIASSLRISFDKLMDSAEYYDLLHKNTCVRDLKVYADAIGAKLYHYADDSGMKCDAVIVREDGAYGLINFLYGSRYDLDCKAQELIKLKEKLDTEAMGEPSFCMVINVTEYDPTLRDDGVWMVPINFLKA